MKVRLITFYGKCRSVFFQRLLYNNLIGIHFKNYLCLRYFKNHAGNFEIFRIIIRMFYNEHNPPHFHAYYNDFKAEIDIQSLEILKGYLSKRIVALTVEWALDHRSELMNDWNLMRNDQPPKPIEPLV